MKPIRLLTLVSLLLGIVILSACGDKTQEPKIFTITLTSNILESTPTYETGELIDNVQSYIITAPEVDNYTFDYWHVAASSTELSTELEFIYTPSRDVTLEAVYSRTVVEVIEDFTLNVSASIESATVTVNEDKTNSGATQYELVAPTVEGYTFVNWINLLDSTVLSTLSTYSFVITSNMTIQAVYQEISPTIYTVTVDSDLTTAVLDITQDGNIITVEASTVTGYVFLHWKNVNTDSIVSFDQIYNFTATADVELEAVYEVYAPSEPTLFYETEFEDASKAAYASGTLTLSGETWTFTDALLGSLATDLSISGQSVRIRDGYIQTEFAISDLAQVIFWVGQYGSDATTTVLFQISTDKTNWVNVDSFTSPTTFERKSYIFDDAMFTTLGLNSSDDYYLRIVSESTPRINIDDLEIYTGEGSVVDVTPLYTITLTDDMVFQYLLNDPVDLTECVATHKTNGDTTCDILGSVDSSVAGVYEITFYKTDEFNRTSSLTVSISIIDPDNDYLSMDLMTYYDDAEGLYGDALIDALHDIINNGFVGVTYGEARYILDDTDVDPNNANNLILIYLGTSVSGAWDGGSTWNREHVWPQSLLGESASNDTVNMASDLYNLMPANPSENTSRGNSPFSALSSGYEPRDEVKGDIARALFYMMVMYDELDLVNTYPGLHEMGFLDELLAWHYADPVDDFELHRMNVIYGEQHNRNPFVDYSHFVDLIWFNDENPPS